jgi:peptidoglycan/xylan/chitin deacetylase (PgdA/CDA1 family)
MALKKKSGKSKGKKQKLSKGAIFFIAILVAGLGIVGYKSFADTTGLKCGLAASETYINNQHDINLYYKTQNATSATVGWSTEQPSLTLPDGTIKVTPKYVYHSKQVFKLMVKNDAGNTYSCSTTVKFSPYSGRPVTKAQVFARPRFPRFLSIFERMKIFNTAINLVVHDVKTSQKKVAITFDDGTFANSVKICPILNQYGAKGTFFVVGSRASDTNLVSGWFRGIDGAKALTECGELANHGWDHTVPLKGKPYSYIGSDLRKAADFIRTLQSTKTIWYRPMTGEYDRNVLTAAYNNNTRLIHWSVMGGDAGAQAEFSTAETIRTNVVNNVYPGSIILLHETGKYTMDALPLILDDLNKQGYTVTTVSDLINSSD